MRLEVVAGAYLRRIKSGAITLDDIPESEAKELVIKLLEQEQSD